MGLNHRSPHPDIPPSHCTSSPSALPLYVSSYKIHFLSCCGQEVVTPSPLVVRRGEFDCHPPSALAGGVEVGGVAKRTQKGKYGEEGGVYCS